MLFGGATVRLQGISTAIECFSRFLFFRARNWTVNPDIQLPCNA